MPIHPRPIDLACGNHMMSTLEVVRYAYNPDTLKMKLVLSKVNGDGVWQMTDNKAAEAEPFRCASSTIRPHQNRWPFL